MLELELEMVGIGDRSNIMWRLAAMYLYNANHDGDREKSLGEWERNFHNFFVAAGVYG